MAGNHTDADGLKRIGAASLIRENRPYAKVTQETKGRLLSGSCKWHRDTNR